MKKPSKMQQRVNDAVVLKDIDNAIASSSNGFWEEAESTFQTAMGGVKYTNGLLYEHLRGLTAIPDFEKKIADAAGLLTNIQVLTADIASHMAVLDAIHAKHEGRGGSTKNSDENMKLITIHGQYQEAMEVYDGTIMPTVTHIFEQIGLAHLVIEQERQAELVKAQDPSVTTDVVAREVKSVDVL